jgi:hypothetical protein
LGLSAGFLAGGDEKTINMMKLFIAQKNKLSDTWLVGHTKSRRREKWMPHEVALLKGLKEFHRNRRSWDWTEDYIPLRTVGACRSKWRKLAHFTTAEKPLSVTPSESSRTLPESWEDLPLIPLEIICSFSTPKVVFKVLPLVCKNFNQLISSRKMPVSCIALKYSTCSAGYVVMLKERVSLCRELWLMDIPVYTHSFWLYSLGKLLPGLKESVVMLRCLTRWQPIIADFISDNKKLRDLVLVCIGYGDKWDWSSMQPCHTLKRFYYNENRLVSERADLAVSKFPNLNQVILPGSLTSFYTGHCRNSWSSQNFISHFKGAIMIGLPALKYTSKITLSISTFDTIYRLLEMVPRLTHLTELKLIFSSFVLGSLIAKDSNGEMGLSLIWICNILRESKSLYRFQLRNMHTALLSDTDSHVFEVLQSLPDSVTEITYKRRTVRPHQSCWS